jgi:hypothetical protein
LKNLDLNINHFQNYRIETLFAREKNREMIIIVVPEKSTVTYKVKNRRGDWGNYEGSSLEDAIAAYNEM